MGQPLRGEASAKDGGTFPRQDRPSRRGGRAWDALNPIMRVNTLKAFTTLALANPRARAPLLRMRRTPAVEPPKRVRVPAAMARNRRNITAATRALPYAFVAKGPPPQSALVGRPSAWSM